MLIFRLSTGNSYSQKRPDYSPSQSGTNFVPPNFGLDDGFHITECVRNCVCWAKPTLGSQPVFVNCTSANKDTVPQVYFHIN